MTLEELAELGRAMRTAQRAYFRRRTAAELDEARSLERQFDRACTAILEPHPMPLFRST
jgi:hypothetical protein